MVWQQAGQSDRRWSGNGQGRLTRINLNKGNTVSLGRNEDIRQRNKCTEISRTQLPRIEDNDLPMSGCKAVGGYTGKSDELMGDRWLAEEVMS